MTARHKAARILSLRYSTKPMGAMSRLWGLLHAVERRRQKCCSGQRLPLVSPTCTAELSVQDSALPLYLSDGRFQHNFHKGWFNQAPRAPGLFWGPYLDDTKSILAVRTKTPAVVHASPHDPASQTLSKFYRFEKCYICFYTLDWAIASTFGESKSSWERDALNPREKT